MTHLLQVFLPPETANTVVSLFIGISVIYGALHIINLIFRKGERHKYLSVKYYLGILAILILPKILPKVAAAYMQNDPWSVKNIAIMKKSLINESDSIGFPFSDKQKNEYADCVVQKMKLKYPKGLSSKDTTLIYGESKNIGKECGKTIMLSQQMNGWNQKFEGFIFSNFFNSKDMEKLYPDTNVRGRVVRCFLEKLKSTYPTGVNFKDLQTKLDTIYTSCYEVPSK